MLHKVCNFGPSSHNLAILGAKMVQKWVFSKTHQTHTMKFFQKV